MDGKEEGESVLERGKREACVNEISGVSLNATRFENKVREVNWNSIQANRKY